MYIILGIGDQYGLRRSYGLDVVWELLIEEHFESALVRFRPEGEWLRAGRSVDWEAENGRKSGAWGAALHMGLRCYWDLVGVFRRTMSAVRLPREAARVLPSPDQ
jgi:hypothetical protein